MTGNLGNRRNNSAGPSNRTNEKLESKPSGLGHPFTVIASAALGWLHPCILTDRCLYFFNCCIKPRRFTNHRMEHSCAYLWDALPRL